MSIGLLALAGLGITLATLSAPVAMAQPPAASPPRIVVEPPLAEPLSRGVVFINYRAEHVLLVPVFGPKAVEVSPPIGHLHVANPNHQPLHRSVVEFVIPARDAATKSH